MTSSHTDQRKPKKADTPPPFVRHPLPADRGIKSIVEIEQQTYQSRSRIDHIAVKITKIAGSASAILIHGVWFAVWLLINIPGLSGITPFDPFPFSLLTMIVSLEAIFLTLFVLVSQNRMSHEADKREQLDLQINLLAERETTMILRMLHEVSQHLGLKGRASEDLQSLLQETRVDELAKKLDGALPPD